MICERVRLVVPDGLGSLPVPSIQISWWYGTDVRIPFALVHQDGTPYSLAGAVSLLLGFKVNAADAAPIIQFAPDAYEDEANGLGYFTIPRAVAPTMGWRRLVLTCGFRDDDTEREDEVLETSTVTIKRRADDFTSPVTVLPSQTPLARGPKGDPGEQGDPGPAGPQPPLSADDPEPVGVAAAGTSTDASPSDHVHPTNGVISLGPTSVWADIQAQIDALPGGSATIMVGNFYAPNQPAGAYEIPADAEVRINACRFVSASGFGLIRMKAGAKLLPDAGGFVDPHLDGVVLITEAAVTDPGTKLFALCPNGGGIWNESNVEASFPECPEAYVNATGQVPPYYVAAPLLAIGSQPVVDVAAGGIMAVIGAGALQCGVGSIGTGVGADVAFDFDEYAAYYFVDPLTGPGSGSLDVFPIKLADSTRTLAGPVGTMMRVAATRQLVVSDGATAKHVVELVPTTLKTAGYSPSAGELVLFSLAGGPFTFPLPASPAPGDKIGLAHRNAEPANALTLDGNGELINGAATQDLAGEWFFATLTFTATTGWILS